MWNIGFEWFTIVDVISPSKDCVEIVFESADNPDVKKKYFVLFEQQVKYIIVDEHKKFKRLKIYFRDDEHSVRVDFESDKYHLLDKLMKSIYNH